MADGDLSTEKAPMQHPSFLRVIAHKQAIKKATEKIKHKIGVYSAKGGVGKTTVAINIAYTLRDMGYKVGLLDADVDTPNISMFLGITHKTSGDLPIKPLEKDGIKILSTAMFMDEATKPIIWRGPMIGKMIEEFFEHTDWGELDYLILDLPPGTSDSPLSLMQLLEIDGFIMVTTPQHIAAVNTIRSGLMAKRLGVAVLGVVETMSEENSNGAKEVAEALKCDIFGRIKYDRKFGDISDKGLVPILEDADIRNVFKEITKKFAR